MPEEISKSSAARPPPFLSRETSHSHRSQVIGCFNNSYRKPARGRAESLVLSSLPINRLCLVSFPLRLACALLPADLRARARTAAQSLGDVTLRTRGGQTSLSDH